MTQTDTGATLNKLRKMIQTLQREEMVQNFGRRDSILGERRRIKEQTIQSRRLQHQLETV